MDRRFLNFKLFEEYLEITKAYSGSFEGSFQESHFWNTYGDMVIIESDCYYKIEESRKLLGGTKKIHKFSK